MIKVYLTNVVTGESRKEYNLDLGVGDLLYIAAGLKYDNTAKLTRAGGEQVHPHTTLNDGEYLLYSGMVKGNAGVRTVQFLIIGSTTASFGIDFSYGQRTVKELLNGIQGASSSTGNTTAAAEIKRAVDGMAIAANQKVEVRVNGITSQSGLDTVVTGDEPGDVIRIMFSQMVKGN